ncbi:MAG TPA: hypothetical protein ENO09_06565 [bacterium]|nr:hypothetical protein [bacterium]
MTQPTSIDPIATRQVIGKQFTTKEITEILIKQNKLREGYYELSVEFMFSAGAAGPSPDEIFPSAFVGVSRLGLIRVSNPTVLSVDAALITTKKTKLQNNLSTEPKPS